MTDDLKCFSETALNDLIAIVTYIAKHNPQAAFKLKEAILDRARILLAQPKLGKKGRVQGTRELVLSGTSYLLVYRVQNSGPQVIRVLHGRQQWPEVIE
jgi:addiction module RelE/StbE family toxin